MLGMWNTDAFTGVLVPLDVARLGVVALAPVFAVQTMTYASVQSVIAAALKAWAPPPKLTLSEWAERYYYLSPETAAEPGRWHTLPYQRAIMDAITDPGVSQISVMKSARVGYTLMITGAIGYYVHQAPAPIMVVQPTVDDAKGYSKEGIAPMLRDCPVLSEIVFEDADDVGPRDSGNTILHKKFPGGVLSMVGANSGAGFRRVSRKVVIFDEVDGYPPSAGSDGDQIKLGTMRSQAYWDRKIIAGSTPLVAGASRIERLFGAGNGQRYFVPCPSCGHMAPFVFNGDGGHRMTWPEGKPGDAFFTCQKNGCVIEHSQKREIVARGEWRAAREPTEDELKNGRHVSFHIWAAYSYAEKASWGEIAKAFIEAKDSPQLLRTFVNTWLGETWKERGDAPDWQRLYERREAYGIGTVPAGVLVLTCGVDVQKDSFRYEVVGWGAGKESWSVDAGVIPADTSNQDEWAKLDELLGRTYPGADGAAVAISCLAVDSGYNTNVVYAWARQHSMDRVIATKGVTGARALISTPTKVDVTIRGKRTGYKVWPLGVDLGKSELYGWLQLAKPKDGEPHPGGFCHFPQYDEEFFRQLTAEHLVSHRDSRGFLVHEWQLIQGRENHFLDCRILARAAASLKGLDRMRPAVRAERIPLPAPDPVSAALRREVQQSVKPIAPGKFLGRPRGGKTWLR